MLKFFRKKLNKKGFTLVELLVVIAVLGIIAGIAIPRMTGVTDQFRKKADEQTAINLIRQIQVNIQTGAIPVPSEATKTVEITNPDGTKTTQNVPDTVVVIMTKAPTESANKVAGAFYIGEEIPKCQLEDAYFIGAVTKDKVIIYRSTTQTSISSATDEKTIKSAPVDSAIE